jgi:uncharacterized membrane protein
MELIIALIFAAGGLICHQRPERSFFFDGHQLPVCARCTGLYLSGALGILGWLLVKLARRWTPLPFDPRLAKRVALLSALPTALSLASGVLGVWDGSNITRALLAIPFGATAGAIVAAVATKDLR